MAIGPGVIKDKISAHSYIVDINGSLKHLHADKLSNYHISVVDVICDTVAVGHVQTIMNHCAIIYDEDRDFGELWVTENPTKVDEGQPEVPPSQRIDLNSLSHLTEEQRVKLLAILDQYAEFF